MKYKLLMVLIMVVADSAYSQFTISSSNQGMSVSGWAQCPPLTVTNYSFSAAGGAVGGGVQSYYAPYIAFANSSAELDTTLSPGLIGFNSSVETYTGSGQPDTGQEMAYASATLSLDVIFSVASPVMFDLAIYYGALKPPYSTFNVELDLSSAENGNLFSHGVGYADFEGVMVPGDIYTLSLSEEMTADAADPLGFNGNFSMDANLTAVPEPRSSALVVLGFCLLVRSRWKRRQSQSFPICTGLVNVNE